MGIRISGVNPNPNISYSSNLNPNPMTLGSDRVKPEFRVGQFLRVSMVGSDQVVGSGSGFGLFVQP